PRGPELHLTEARGPELLVADDPRAAHLRIGLQVEVPAEGAVAVDPEAERQEVTVPDVEDVLEEESRVPDLPPAFGTDAVGGRAHRGHRGAREVCAAGRDRRLEVAGRLPAPREARADGLRGVERESA